MRETKGSTKGAMKRGVIMWAGVSVLSLSQAFLPPVPDTAIYPRQHNIGRRSDADSG